MRLAIVYKVLLVFLLFSGCDKFDKEEPVPAYVFIERIDLAVNADGSQGSNAHDIKDAWVFANGELIGVFELPCMVPILKKDSVILSVFAGIKVNGAANNRKFYPFYEEYKAHLFLKPTLIDTLKPIVNYKKGVKFPWIEDFEDNAVSMEKTGVTATVDSLKVTSLASEVFEYSKPGNRYSGKVDFRGKRGTFENSSIDVYDLPRGSDIYLEVNYRSDVNVEFGFYPKLGSTFSQGVSVYIGYPDPLQWKKAYIRLSGDINNSENTGKKFRIFIGAINFEDKPAIMLIDNIKLVHF